MRHSDDDTPQAADDRSLKDAYMHDVRRVAHLADRQTSDRAALWAESTRLVLSILEKLKRRGAFTPEHELDMIQEGNLAVGRWMPAWDPSKGAWSTFITPYIRGAMLDYLGEVHQLGVSSKRSSVLRVALDGGDTDDDDRGDEDTTPEGLQLSYDDSWGDPEREALRDQLRDHIWGLPEDERYVILAYYYRDATIQEIADATKRSVGGVHKIIRRAEQRVKSTFTLFDN